MLIQRLSQKSRERAPLIMATQRPSVDVITGVIKATLPTRISFAFTSRIDSRTTSASKAPSSCSAKDDMLYKPNTQPIMRVHGPFVSDEEVERVADHWRAQAARIRRQRHRGARDGGFGFDDLDATASDNPEDRKVPPGLPDRVREPEGERELDPAQMGVGYNTAAKWISDGSRRAGGAGDHVGRREIYRDKDGNVPLARLRRCGHFSRRGSRSAQSCPVLAVSRTGGQGRSRGRTPASSTIRSPAGSGAAAP